MDALQQNNGLKKALKGIDTAFIPKNELEEVFQKVNNYNSINTKYIY